MQSRTKTLVLRGMGGLIAAMAVLPWLAGTSAQAASPNDGDCSTRPSGVSSSATCALLLGPNGKTVFGETWVERTSGNDLVVKTFPNSTPDGSDAVTLCVTKSGPYGLKHQCNSGDPDNVFTGNATSISIALDKVGISASDPVYYSLSVLQASTTANSNGNGGAAPSPSPSASPTKSPSKTPTPTPTPTPTDTSPSASPSHTHTHSPTPTPTDTSPSASPSHTHTHSPTPTPTSPSPSVSASKTSQTPSASVSATQSHRTDAASPSTSVLGVKLAHTGADGTVNALALSVGLLAVGGILVAAGQSNRPKRRH
jgi:hypothetical protein